MSESNTAPAPAAPEPAAPAAPAAADWRAALPQELREAPAMARFDAPDKLAKSYLELETLVGRKGVIVPGEKDGPEVHARFRQAMGIPEKPEGYELKPPAGAEAVWNPENAKAFAGWAHELGLTPRQAQGIAERFAALQAEGAKAAADGIEPDGRRMEDVLRGEWGQAYDTKVELARRAARQFSPDAAVLDALEAKVGGSALLRMFARIGEAMGEDQPAGMGTGRSGMLTPDQAKAEIEQLTRDMKGPYWNGRDPAHRRTVERVTELHRIAAG